MFCLIIDEKKILFFTMEMTMTQAHINVQKCDFGGGGEPSELDRMAAIEAFKELGEGLIHCELSLNTISIVSSTKYISLLPC